MLPPSSLIICTRNRPQMLRETVESVLAGDELPSEIVIVDQSAPAAPSLNGIGDPRGVAVRHLASQSIGLSRGRNEAIAAAHHALLAFVDDDMFVAPDWYGTLIRTLVAEGPGAVVTGRVLAAQSEHRRGFAPSLVTAEERGVYQGRIGRDILAAGHMAMYRSAVDKVGAFDERLGAGARFAAADDNEFGYRLLEAGFRIVYEPRTVVYHRAWRTHRDFVPLRWSYGRGQGGFYAKYLSASDPYMLRRMLADVARRTLWLPYRIVRRPKRALGDAVFVAGMVHGVVDWLWTERRPR